MMSKERYLIVFHRLLSVFILILLTQSVLADNIKSILSDYASARSTFDSVSATCCYSYEQVVYNGKDILFEHSSNKIADFRRDTELFEWIIRDVTDSNLTGEVRAITSNIWDGEKEYLVYRSPNIDVNNKDGYRITVKKDKTIMKSLSLSLVYSNLTGIFYGDTKTFDEILSTSSDGISSLRYETIGSSKCIVLESDNSYGNFQVWMDPERGYNIVKAIITKGPEDLYFGKPLKSYEYASTKQDETSSSKPTKTHTMTETIVKIDNVTLEKQGHLWVPVSSDHEKILKFSDGVINNVKINCKVEQLEVAPDFDRMNAFKVKVPNGTRVLIQEFPEIRYEWQHGKIILFLDNSFLGELDKNIESYEASTKAVETESSATKDMSVKNRINSEKNVSTESTSNGRPSHKHLRLALFVMVLLVLVLAVYKVCS